MEKFFLCYHVIYTLLEHKNSLSFSPSANGRLNAYFWSFSVADPGFPLGGGANPPGGAPTYDFAKFSQKTA